MKSFFKKLAFVMALAMVVSMAAPAARTAFAATAFTYAEQREDGTLKDEIVRTLTMKAGDKVDLGFKGVKDYKSYTLKWVSSDETVATVDKMGVVTAVADGVAEVWLKVGDGTVYTSTPVVVTVGEVMNVALGTSKEDTFTEKTLKVGDEGIDLNFYGVKDWSTKKYSTTWASEDPTVATVDKMGVVKALKPGTTKVTLVIQNRETGVVYVPYVVFTVESTEEKLSPKQLTATTVLIQFVNEHSFDATGEELKNNEFKTVKLYRKFTTEEMAKMSNKNGLKLDEEGNGYQAYYVKDTFVSIKENSKEYEEDPTAWVIEGYNAFVDGATYTVVYGENETSSTLKGIKQDFVAYVGKVSYIKVMATDATVENDVEPAIAAVLVTKLYNSHGIDLTDYYGDADETDYEIVEGATIIDASISNDEVTFDEPGMVLVRGTYSFYDEDKEADVPISAVCEVKGFSYSSYKVEKIYNWTLASGYKYRWSATKTDMIAGDEDQLYVIVVDNRGNYYSNVPGIEKEDYKIPTKVQSADGEYFTVLKQVLEIGDGVENTAFEQYGYELVFDSLDPDSLLVDDDGAVESYKKTNSFAVVSYRNKDAENAKLREIGVMGIQVKDARRLKSVEYTNGTSFTILKETEAEDGIRNFYGSNGDFNTSAVLKIAFKNQYGEGWPYKAVDSDEVVTNFTVTTTKNEFSQIAEDIADALNSAEKSYKITPEMFVGTTTTSVSFKIKESATGNSQTVTIKLDEPKYTDDGEVYVDPVRAILETGNVEMYTSLSTLTKLFQVSKATQKIGYFRIGNLEDTALDDEHGYYIGNDLPKNFVKSVNGDLSFVEDITTTTATGSALATDSALVAPSLKVGDYILVVTDPSGKVFPAQGSGGNGKSFGPDSGLGIVANGNTGYRLVVAAVKNNGEMEYAATGTYRATVYKVTNIVDNKNTKGDVISTKYNTTRVASASFNVGKTTRDLVFYHQEVTKDVEVSEFIEANNGIPDQSILKAIADTMTFRINGGDVVFGAEIRDDDGNVIGKLPDDQAAYRSLLKFDDGDRYDYHSLPIEIASVEYKVQNNGKRAVIDTITVKIYTPAGGYYLSKVKVNRSVNVKED